MKNSKSNQLFMLGLNKSVLNIMFWLGLFAWSAASTAARIDASARVSQDIARFEAFNTQSKASNEGSRGGFVTIGADAACGFDSAVDSIQDAIDAGAVEIRVASNGMYQNNLTLENQSVVIRGGFTDCVAADANIQDSTEPTLIDGSTLAEPVIYITGSEAIQNIRLENLILTGGSSIFPKFGGGISVQLAAVELQLSSVAIIGNSGSAGAGMDIDPGSSVKGISTTVTGRDVVFQFNQSSSIGGGLRCLGQADVVLGGMSIFANNTGNIGGGIYVASGCQMSMYSELRADSLVDIAGLYDNISLSDGGGASVTGNADLYLFGQRMCDDSECLGSNQVPIRVENNEAGTSTGLSALGGGLFVSQSGRAYANGLLMSGNTTRQHGGGIYVGIGSEVEVERHGRGCWDADRCNLLIANNSGVSAGLGGGVFVDDGQITLSQTYFEENRADFGTAISASGEAAIVTLESVVMDDNGDGGNDGYADNSVIRADLGATVSIRHSTVVDNELQGSVFDVGIALDSSMFLSNSIVHDPDSGNLFGPGSGALTISCLLAHEDSSFSGNQVVVDEPQFMNRLEGDFHLNLNSPAIDMCQGIPMFNPLEIDAEPRGWDDPQNNNGLGNYDAGADESYVNDVIFKDGVDD